MFSAVDFEDFVERYGARALETSSTVAEPGAPMQRTLFSVEISRLLEG
ncbi:hypothetical protein K5F93_17980 [Pseudomonas protegens]|nr:hypothetical protein [Pseudomonas protegens]QZI68310.1 hypothetical protein K5F93_17980 [Pseudomonas protegens]